MRLLVLAVLLLVSACSTVQVGDDASVLAEMRALEVERGQAIRTNDPARLNRIYAEDFIGVAGNGRQVTREQLYASFARAQQAPELFEGSTSEVLSAEAEGDIIVVIGRLRFGDADSMYTHVFRRRGDRWELFRAAATPILAPS